VEEGFGIGNQGERQLTATHTEAAIEDYAANGDPAACVPRQVLGSCRVFQFHDTSESARIRAKTYINDNRQLHGDAGNLAAFLHMLKETKPPYYRRIVDTIREVAPHFGDFVVEPDKLSPTEIMLNWREAGADYLFGPHQLPDGLLRFMALAALLLQPEDDLPDVLVIDEPELGLHPYAMNVLGSLIRKASAHCQVILATQSVNLVDQFQPGEIVTVQRTDNASTFRRLRSEELADWLDEYSLSELWEKNVIGGRPSR
jgi:predicted ATPase